MQIPNLPQTAQGQRLDTYLASTQGRSRTYWQRLIKSGHVQVNSLTAKANHLLETGDTIAWSGDHQQSRPKKLLPDIKVVYLDNDILIIDKPAAILTHASNPQADEETIADFARRYTNDPDTTRAGIVHRLDRDTSGLLIIARNPAAKRHFQRLFHDRLVTKTYLALLNGRLELDAAVIKLPLGRHATRPLRRIVKRQGRMAVTAYKAIAHYPGYTLIEASPQTGRTHQIRAHFAHLGHPIAGDKLYGDKSRHLSRQFLHASQLEFSGPDGRHHKYTSPLPPDLQQFLDQIAQKTRP